MKPATRQFDWPFTPMPHSNNSNCTSGQCPTSTAVSHSFIVTRYSSPSFGSHGRTLSLRTLSIGFGTGDPAQSGVTAVHREMDG